MFILTYKRYDVINFYLNYSFARYILLICLTLKAGPRPFMEKNNLKNLEWSCASGFGSFDESIFFFIIVIEFMYDFRIKKIKSEIKKNLIIFFICLFIMSVSFFSIYSGRHTIPYIFASIACALYYSLIYRLYGFYFIQNSLNYFLKK